MDLCTRPYTEHGPKKHIVKAFDGLFDDIRGRGEMEHQPPPCNCSLLDGKNSRSTPKGSHVVNPEKSRKMQKNRKTAEKYGILDRKSSKVMIGKQKVACLNNYRLRNAGKM